MLATRSSAVLLDPMARLPRPMAADAAAPSQVHASCESLLCEVKGLRNSLLAAEGVAHDHLYVARSVRADHFLQRHGPGRDTLAPHDLAVDTHLNLGRQSGSGVEVQRRVEDPVR